MKNIDKLINELVTETLYAIEESNGVIDRLDIEYTGFVDVYENGMVGLSLSKIDQFAKVLAKAVDHDETFLFKITSYVEYGVENSSFYKEELIPLFYSEVETSYNQLLDSPYSLKAHRTLNHYYQSNPKMFMERINELEEGSNNKSAVSKFFVKS